MGEPLRNEPPDQPEIGLADAHPQVFRRAIVTPPAPPWEQARAAHLDARHGAPLPLSDLVYRVKRLSSWAPSRPGRFAAFYVRARELRGPFETSVDIDGQAVKVAFGRSGEGVQRAQGWAAILLLLVLVGVLFGGGVTLALGARAQATARLETAEKLGASKLNAARAYRSQEAQAREVRAALGKGKPIGDLIGDLTWLATSKAPEVRFAAVHWQGGVMAVEVRGDQAPFTAPDRRLERAPRPLRPGVWLWGIGPAQGYADRTPPLGRAGP